MSITTIVCRSALLVNGYRRWLLKTFLVVYEDLFCPAARREINMVAARGLRRQFGVSSDSGAFVVSPHPLIVEIADEMGVDNDFERQCRKVNFLFPLPVA
jgi:hypothetical protein